MFIRSATGCYDSVVLTISLICSSASCNSIVILNNTRKVALVCQNESGKSRCFHNAITPYPSNTFRFNTTLSWHVYFAGHQCSYYTLSLFKA